MLKRTNNGDDEIDGEGLTAANFADLTIPTSNFANDSDDDSLGMEVMAVSEIPKDTVKAAKNDETALKAKLEEISVFSGQDSSFWASLSITMPMKQYLSDDLAVDELQREKTFGELATESAHLALEELRKHRIKFRRPSDYFAEMVKSDDHMAKMKSKLLHQREVIASAEKRRNNREITKKKKRRSEQLEREQEKNRKSKKQVQAIEQLRKQRLKDRADGNIGDDDDDEFPIDLIEVEQLDDNVTVKKQNDNHGRNKHTMNAARSKKGLDGKTRPRNGKGRKIAMKGKRKNPRVRKQRAAKMMKQSKP